MIGRTFALLALLASIGCSSHTTEANPATLTPDAIAGSWRSITPQAEFIRLTVASTSVEQGLLAARLTFSGVALEGSGRIAGDSVLFSMMPAGTVQPTSVMVARVRDAETLMVQLRQASLASSISPLDLTLVRGN